MKRYDMHTHTCYSACGNMKPERLLIEAKRKRLDGIAITDHHTIKGALEAKRLNKDRNFEVIVGEEIETENGHILGYFIKKEIKQCGFDEAIRRIRKQGGIAVVAHPYDFMRGMKDKKKANALDAIEIMNGRTRTPFANKRSLILARRFRRGMTAGSDAHFWFEVGKVKTAFDGQLKESILTGRIKAEGWGIQTPFTGFFSMINIIRRGLVDRVNHLKH